LISELQFLDIKNPKVVLDRGFYSADNINLLYKNNINFIISLRKNLKFVSNIYTNAKQILLNQFDRYKYYDSSLDVYSYTNSIMWNYVQKNAFDQIEIEEKRELFIHIYYNEERGTRESREFLKDLDDVKTLIMDNKPLSTYQKSILSKFLFIKNNDSSIEKEILINNEAIENKIHDLGFFVLISDHNNSSHKVIDLYRNKDVIEKAFDNIKDRLEFKRTEVHSDKAFDNKLFIAFISLIFISYIDNKLKENRTYKSKTMNQILDILDVIEVYNYGYSNQRYSEITTKQRQLFLDLNVKPPT
jgi:transposase